MQAAYHTPLLRLSGYDPTTSLTGCGDRSRIADACTCIQGNDHRAQGRSQTTTVAIPRLSNHDLFVEGEVHIILCWSVSSKKPMRKALLVENHLQCPDGSIKMLLKLTTEAVLFPTAAFSSGVCGRRSKTLRITWMTLDDYSLPGSARTDI